MVPHIQNAAEARAIVEACLYAPKSHRSAFGSGPQLGFAAVPQAEVCKILNEQTLLMAMIETPEDFEYQSWLLRLGVRYLTGGSDVGYIPQRWPRRREATARAEVVGSPG
jgi:HpcH/HpaI aldolase/citrate lyase family